MKRAAVLDDLKRFERDSRWIHSRFRKLRRRFPGQFVAVFNGSLIAHADSIRKLRAAIRRSRAEAVGMAAVEYLPAENLQLIL
jgi:hypothetical protein